MKNQIGSTLDQIYLMSPDSLQKDCQRSIRAIAFDLDGLMVNTEDIYDEVCQLMLSRRGGHFNLELKLKMMGRPGPIALEIMRTECGLRESIEELQQEVEHEFHRIMPATVRPLDGLMDLLEHLEQLGIAKCVATSSFRKHAHGVLHECDLAARFDFVLTSEDVTHGKPEPDIYLLAAERHSVLPEELLVFEDSVQGSLAGVASGATTIAVPGRHSVNCDYSHVEHVAKSLADPLIFSLLPPPSEGLEQVDGRIPRPA